MNDVPEIPRTPGVEFVGPFGDNTYRIAVDGYRLFGITAHLSGEDRWSLVLDERFALDASHEECQRWLWWVANAMAISAGYSSFGENCQPTNRYKVRMIGIGGDDEAGKSPHEE